MRWENNKKAEELVKSGLWAYTGKWEYRTIRKLGSYGYGETELYYELRPRF